MVEQPMKRRDPNSTLGALDLLEEAMHTLRLTSPATLLCYFVGAVPFVLAVLFFWSDMSRSGLAEKHLISGALGLALLFAWMKLWQSIFAARLRAQIAGEPNVPLTFSALLRTAAAQAFLQSTGLFLFPIVAQILLPAAWTVAFYQNASVLGLRESSLRTLVRRSWKQACFAPAQNHISLVVLSLFGFFLMLSLGITMLVGPMIFKMLLGVETNFTLSVESMLNSTFLAVALGLAYLCLDPVVKTLYVLRCFYGESRQSGEDLRVALRSYQSKPALAVLLVFILWAAPITGAETKPTRPEPTPRAAELDRSIDEVLQRPEYTWRAPRPMTEAKEESSLRKRTREWFKATTASIQDWFEKLVKSSRRGKTNLPGNFSLSAHGLIYVLIAVVLVIVVLLGWLLWRSRSRTRQAELEAVSAPAMPDLTNDDVSGDELPEDGWSRLALELIERGDLRLAMRAFYLASLAHLAGRSLVSIARFKSNRDYERELLRRSHALPLLTKTFSENVSVFDRVWYGRHDIDASLLQQFRLNVERIKSC